MFDLRTADYIIRDCDEVVSQEPNLNGKFNLIKTAWLIIKIILFVITAAMVILFLGLL